MKREEEHQITEKIKEGDLLSFRKLVDTYSPNILSVIRGIIDNEEDAREISQDVFVKAYFSIQKFRGDSSLSTWLFRIAYNLSISHLRKRRFTFVSENDYKIPESCLRSEEDDDIDCKESKIRLIESITETLCPEDKFLLNLFYEQDKSIKEISSIMGLTESNVKVKLHRIKKRIAEIAEKKMEVSYG